MPEDLDRHPDALVIGGGVIGPALALFCHQAALGRVLVIEARQSAAAASGGAGGALAPELHQLSTPVAGEVATLGVPPEGRPGAETARLAHGPDPRVRRHAVSIEPPRTTQQRKHDTLARLDGDIDAWVATASADGDAYLVPLSYVWDGNSFTMTTPEASPTGRNLRASRRVRLAIGPTRDVVLIEGIVETFSKETVPSEVAEAFAAKLWDARLEKARYAYFRITPQRIQAWREANELADRDLMRDGRWLV